MQVFSREWFERHQLRLVRFANSELGRNVFGIPKAPVIGVSPAGVSIISGLDLKHERLICECRAQSKNVYARRLRKYGAPLWWTLHALDSMILDHQRLVPNFGFLTLSDVKSAVGSAYCYDCIFTATAGAGAPGLPIGTVRGSSVYWAVDAGSLSAYLGMISSGTTAGNVTGLRRSGYLFDTTSIGRAGKVSAVSLFLTESGAASVEAPWATSTNNDLVFVPFAPASLSSPVVNDFDNFTASPLAIVAWTGAGNYWGSPFSGGASISLSISTVIPAVETKIMSMFRGDMNNSAPGATSGYTVHYYVASRDNTSGHPQLTVTYSYPVKVTIGDSWKDVSRVRVNIGDDWKDLSALKVNIGDVWKVVF